MALSVFLIANPTLMLNGEIVPFVPNSLSSKRGFGEVSVRAESAGTEVNIVSARNLQSAVGYLTFKIYPRPALISLLIDAQNNYGLNTVEVVDAAEIAFNQVMKGASIINDPDLNIQADGEIEVQMKGLRWVIQA